MAEQGGAGRFQYLVFLMVELPTMTTGLMAYCMSFLMLPPDFVCDQRSGKEWQSIPADSDLHRQLCNPTYFCTNSDTIRWQIDANGYNSLRNWMTDFRLECESGRAIGMVGGSYFFGYIVSTLITKQIVDGMGRKRAFWLSRGIQAFVYLCMVSLPTEKRYFQWFYVLLFLMGLQNNVNRTAGCNYYCEIMPHDKKDFFIAFMEVFENGGEVIIALYFMLTDGDWRVPYLCATAVIIILMVAALIWTPESPHYLYERKRFVECSEALLLMGRFNGVENQPLAEQLGRVIVHASEEDESDSWDIRETICSKPTALRNLIVLSILWATDGYTYVLINYTLKYLDGSVYFNALGATTAGVCGVLFAGKLMAALPLKRMFRLSYVLSGSAMLVLTFSSDGWPRPLLALLVALAYGGTQSASTALFYANESLFDVKAVAASFSVCGLFSRCACALAPISAEFKPEIIFKLMFVAFTVMAFFATGFLIQERKR